MRVEIEIELQAVSKQNSCEHISSQSLQVEYWKMHRMKTYHCRRGYNVENIVESLSIEWAKWHSEFGKQREIRYSKCNTVQYQDY